jgi:hypothetical protein
VSNDGLSVCRWCGIGVKIRVEREILVAGEILRRRLGLDISRGPLLNSPVGLFLHAPQTQHPGAYPPCPVGIPAGLREGGCEGEGEKFLMGIMTACHADPGLHPCVLAGDARSSFAPSAAKPAIEGVGPSAMHPYASIGTKESIRGPSRASVCFHSQLGLARDCQRVAETAKMPANTETPPHLREFPSSVLCHPRNSATAPTQSSTTTTDHQNFHSFACARDCSLGSHRLPILGVGWRYVSVSPYGTIPCLAGLNLHGYSTVARYA